MKNISISDLETERLILKKPTLDNYLASNECYKKIGYEEKGVLLNFSCSN